MQRQTDPAIPPIPAVLLGVLSVQGGAALAKGLFPVLGATGTVGLRVALSALILVVTFRPRVTGFTARQWRAVIPYGMVLGMMNLVFYLAIARIPLGLGVTLEFVGPLGVAVAGSRRALDVLWVLLAGAGIALIAPWSGSGIDPLGVALALGAGGLWAAYILLGGHLSRVLSGGAAVAVGMSIATVIVLPVSLAGGGLARLTPALFAAGLGVALLSSAVPYTLEMVALEALPARTFGILMSIEPAMAALAGLVFLNEVLSAAQWVAIVLVIAASAGATLTTRRATKVAEV